MPYLLAFLALCFSAAPLVAQSMADKTSVDSSLPFIMLTTGSEASDWETYLMTDLRFIDLLPGERAEIIYRWNRLAKEKVLITPKPTGFSQKGGDFHQLYWQYMMYDWIRDSPAFADPALKEPIDEDFRLRKLGSVDTIVTMEEVETTKTTDQPQKSKEFREKKTLVFNEMNPEDIVGIRINHRLYWDAKNNTLGNEVLSFTPMMETYNEKGNVRSYVPLDIWFPITNATNAKELWRADACSFIASTEADVLVRGPEAAKPSKGTFDPERFFRPYTQSPQVELLNPMDREGVFTKEEISRLILGSTDTIASYDPNTYEETLHVVERSLDWEQLRKLRLIHRWYWTPDTYRLRYTFVGWAPVYSEFDNGEFLFDHAIFYRANTPR